MKLTSKFTLIFSAIILFMGYISFYGIYSFQYDILEQDITENLENSAESHLDKLDRMFYERLSDLDILSANPVFISNHPNRTRMSAVLEDFLSKYPQYASVTYFDLDRNVIASSGVSKRAYKQHPLTEYWPAIYEGRDHIVNISRSTSLQVPTLHLADRVIDARGKTRGILVARVPVEELYGLMNDKREAQGAQKKYELDILDRDGTVLYSNHSPNSILNVVDEDFGLIQEALPAVRTVGSLTEIHREAHSTENKVLMVFAKEQGYRSFKGNGWILKVVHSSEDAFASVSDLSRQVFIFLLAISLLGIATILSVLLFTVVRPIKKINNATTLLGEGKLDTRVSVDSSDEIGRLGQSFNAMASNLKDAREQLANAADVALARAKLAERKIIEISEETQQQIGRELHDDLGQQLTGVAFMAEVLRHQLKTQHHAEAENAAKITALINEAIAKANNLAHGLYPVEMKESGLRAMLMRLASNTQSIYGIACDFTCDGEPKTLTPMTNTNLFRIAQEAVHNAVKHSGAKKISIRLAATQDSLVVEISDNGRGIGSQPELDTKSGLGMRTMQYRASLLNAHLHISQPQGGGTCVTINLAKNMTTM
ncbi:MAG TPA: cache domain-containing protein [Gallionellaceae bacterium]